MSCISCSKFGLKRDCMLQFHCLKIYKHGPKMEEKSLILLFLLILPGIIPSIAGLRCYACFYDESSGLGHMCVNPNRRDYITECKSQSDVDKAIRYIGATFELQQHQQEMQLMARSGSSSGAAHTVEEGIRFVCLDAQGDFTRFGLGKGIYRSCWSVPQSEKVSCGNIKLHTFDNYTVDGCFCDKNHKDGSPCNGEHGAVDSEQQIGLLQARNGGSHDKHDEAHGAHIEGNVNSGGTQSLITPAVDALTIFLITLGFEISFALIYANDLM